LERVLKAVAVLWSHSAMQHVFVLTVRRRYNI